MPNPTPRPDIAARLDLHRAYWERRDMKHPLAAFRITPDFFLSRNYKAAHHLLEPGAIITADMLRVDDFLPDYERMYHESERIGQDAFFTAEPYVSMPWLEAMLGCTVVAGDSSFISEPWIKDPEQIKEVKLRPDNPWLLKYLEFTKKLVALSDGRFPVGQPIMRGPADVVGALVGQAEMVLAMMDEPEIMKDFFMKAGAAQAEVVRRQKELLPPFHGGDALGFYHVWTPGPCVWYQEDLSTIMSPDMYDEFLRDAERAICQGYDYTAVHLHPASFFILDQLLENDFLKAIQVNKDVGGPTVPEMLPQIKKIVERKNFIFWGDLTVDDIHVLRDNLPAKGLFFFTTAENFDDAAELLAAIRAW